MCTTAKKHADSKALTGFVLQKGPFMLFSYLIFHCNANVKSEHDKSESADSTDAAGGFIDPIDLRPFSFGAEAVRAPFA